MSSSAGFGARCVWCLLVGLLVLGAPTPSHAQSARTGFLVRVLVNSTHFRVRSQAALALGTLAPEQASITALATALRDEHPAVRSASASSLELLRAPSVLPALRAAQGDPDGTTRVAINRAIVGLERLVAARLESESRHGFYVAVGTVRALDDLSAPTLRRLREHVLRQIAQLDGVRVAPEGESAAGAMRVLSKTHRVGMSLDGSVTNLEPQPDGALRAEVVIGVGSYPEHELRVNLSGTAVLSGEGVLEERRLRVTEAALDGALAQLPRVMRDALASAK